VFWTGAALLCGLGLLMNASKAALVIGLLILPWPFMTWLLRLKPTVTMLWAGGAVLLIAAGLLVSVEISHESAVTRMTETNGVTISFDARMAAYEEYIDAVPVVGWFGLGPGLFHLAFPYQTSPLANVGAAIRDYAHEDYLQTVLEWGWLGTVWWTLLVGGGLYRAFQSYRQRELFTSKGDRRLLLAAILGVGGTLAEALMDFPLQIASIRLCFLVLLALCWASPRLLATPPPQAAPHRRKFRIPSPQDPSTFTPNPVTASSVTASSATTSSRAP
jgi:O-antigen ligase